MNDAPPAVASGSTVSSAVATRPSLRRMLLGLVVALSGALLCVWIHIPLPWLIGPLVLVALVCMLYRQLPPPPAARQLGQWAIGVALGLYFSPDVMREVLRLAPWLAAAVLFAVLLGAVGAWLLQRATGVDPTTAFFAMAIGGASEMAAQAQRHHGRIDRVAAAHSLRIMLVVLIVPLALNASGVRGADPYEPLAGSFDPVGFAVLCAVTLGAAAAMVRFGSPNSWMLGPLLAAAAITATGHTFSSLPTPVINGGQLLIGISLGAHFTREFFRSAPRYLACVAAITLVYLLCGALFGVALGWGAGLSWPTAVVATTPGGIGEMALTAKALQLGVPIVTAFHAIRMAAVVISAGLVYVLWQRRRAAR
ncbi:MAG TPA: AbrB family transcriptional regulator [Burkholderiaceae bacterium]|nr:AbrB family transcriptional regulator [Burkholderiaceae bacterium]